MKAALWRRPAWILLAGVLVLCGVWIYSRGQSPGNEVGRDSDLARAQPPSQKAAATASPGPVADEDPDPMTDEDAPDAGVMAALVQLLDDLRAKLPADAIRSRLAEVKLLVHEADPHEAAAALIKILETGVDEPTGLRFEVGAEGVMQGSPTYRTALLDLLGQTEPEMSAAYALSLMAQTPSADEYALALRNVAWTDFQGSLKPELTGYLSAMLDRTEWMNNPTEGFLEAFDCAVFVGAVDRMVPLLEPPSDQGESATGHAAFVALDRMTLRDPQTIGEMFRADPQFMAQTPFHRASLLSRLDIRDPGQAAVVKDYLRRQDHAPEELQYFTEVFPNKNSFAGHRLITGWEEGFSIAEIDASDAATLQVLREWIGTPELGSRASELQAMADRLERSLRGEEDPEKESDDSP